MAHWILKAAVQGTASLLPRSQAWNYFLRKYITGSLELDAARFRFKLLHARRHLENYFRTQIKEGERFNVVELGTGWYPVIPIAVYLCGATKIWTIDKQSLLHFANVKKTLELFVDFAQQGGLIEILPWVYNDRVCTLAGAKANGSAVSGDEILRQLNIEVMVQDARYTGLEPGSVDFIFSNSVLQEIPEFILLAIFAEFRRLASSTAAMSHYVNMVEPYVQFDRSLTTYHFLQYSDLMWALVNNSLHYHNRLRIPDYRRIHHSASFRILQEDNERGSAEDLDKVSLARRFQHYSRNDLLITRSWIASRRQD